MSEYIKPAVLGNADLAEGVYAASGNKGPCWTGSVHTTQAWNGNAHVYQVDLTHLNTFSHFSEACTCKFFFDGVVVEAWAEGAGNYDVQGKGSAEITVTRTHHANGEFSGDSVSYKLFAVAADQASTEALSKDPRMEIVSCLKTGTPNYPEID